jgi:Ribonuclease G/E
VLILVATKAEPTMFARIAIMRALNRDVERVFDLPRKGVLQAQEVPMTVFVYINTAKQLGDVDYVKVFVNVEAAERWFEEHDPEGVAFEYDVLE